MTSPSRPKCWSELPEIPLCLIFSHFDWQELQELCKVYPWWHHVITEQVAKSPEGRKKKLHYNWLHGMPKIRNWTQQLAFNPSGEIMTVGHNAAIVRDEDDLSKFKVAVVEKDQIWPIELDYDVKEASGEISKHLVVIVLRENRRKNDEVGSGGQFDEETLLLFAWERNSHELVLSRQFKNARRQKKNSKVEDQPLDGLFSCENSSIMLINDTSIEILNLNEENKSFSTLPYHLKSFDHRADKDFGFYNITGLQYHISSVHMTVEDDEDEELHHYVFKLNHSERTIDQFWTQSFTITTCYTNILVKYHHPSCGITIFMDEDEKYHDVDIQIPCGRSLYRDVRMGAPICLDISSGRIVCVSRLDKHVCFKKFKKLENFNISYAYIESKECKRDELKVYDFQAFLDLKEETYPEDNVIRTKVTRRTNTVDLGWVEGPGPESCKQFITESAYVQVFLDTSERRVFFKEFDFS